MAGSLFLFLWLVAAPVCLSFQLNMPLFVGRNHHNALSMSSLDTEEDEAIGAWIPIASAKALTGLGPQQITVMGMDLVVWEGDDGAWSVMSDVCPHRMAPLSQGRVDPDTNCIECPYHGWQFDTNGTLTKLPQLELDRPLESVKGGNANGLPVHTCGDMIYAFLPSSVHGEMFPQSLLPQDMYPTLREEVARNATYYTRELPYSTDFVIENFMDPAHIPFAHHSLQSVRTDGKPIPMTTLVSNFTHVEVTFQDESRGNKRDGIASWQRPSVYHFRTKKAGKRTYTTDLNIHIVPVKAGRSRVLFSSNFISWIPTWLQHAGSNRFLNTDAWLHDAELACRSQSSRKLPYVFASESDLGVRAFRQWWSKHGFSNAPPNTFGPSPPEELRKLSRRQQVNPWEYHSKHCSSCRRALRVMKRIQAGGLATSIASAIFIRRKWPAAIVAAIALYTSYMAQKTATIIEGNPSPSGYSDRSPAHEEDYDKVTLLQKLRKQFGRRK